MMVINDVEPRNKAVTYFLVTWLVCYMPSTSLETVMAFSAKMNILKGV